MDEFIGLSIQAICFDPNHIIPSSNHHGLIIYGFVILYKLSKELPNLAQNCSFLRIEVKQQFPWWSGNFPDVSTDGDVGVKHREKTSVEFFSTGIGWNWVGGYRVGGMGCLWEKQRCLLELIFLESIVYQFHRGVSWSSAQTSINGMKTLRLDRQFGRADGSSWKHDFLEAPEASIVQG